MKGWKLVFAIAAAVAVVNIVSYMIAERRALETARREVAR
jgi:hypothetical protein